MEPSMAVWHGKNYDNMANAKRDENHVPTMTAILNTDGVTVVNIVANPTTHALVFMPNGPDADNGPVNAKKDDNFVSTLLGVSSADGVTPVPIYATSDGKLMITNA